MGNERQNPDGMNLEVNKSEKERDKQKIRNQPEEAGQHGNGVSRGTPL